MSITIASTDRADILWFEATWFEGLTPRSFHRFMTCREVSGFLACCPGAWVAYN